MSLRPERHRNRRPAWKAEEVEGMEDAAMPAVGHEEGSQNEEAWRRGNAGFSPGRSE